MTDCQRTNAAAPEVEVSPDQVICNFWIRVLALCCDLVILGIIGTALGFTFGNQFSQIGNENRLVGLAIALVYFSLFNSEIGKGRTPGKQIMKIRVIGENGECISFFRALLRTAILVSAYFLDPVISSYADQSFVAVLMDLILSGLEFGILFFYVFNRKTRQSIHDLSVRTYVVYNTPKNKIARVPIPRIYYTAFISLVVFIFIVILTIRSFVFSAFSPAVPVVKKLHQIEGVSRVNYRFLKKYKSGDNRQSVKIEIVVAGNLVSYTKPYVKEDTTMMNTRSSWKHEQSIPALGLRWTSESNQNPFSRLSHPPLAPVKAIAEEAAKIVMESDLYIKNQDEIDEIMVTLKYGYNLGISSEWLLYDHRYR